MNIKKSKVSHAFFRIPRDFNWSLICASILHPLPIKNEAQVDWDIQEGDSGSTYSNLTGQQTKSSSYHLYLQLQMQMQLSTLSKVRKSLSQFASKVYFLCILYEEANRWLGHLLRLPLDLRLISSLVVSSIFSFDLFLLFVLLPSRG